MDDIELDAIVPRRRACRVYLGVSATTAWRREREDPAWPKPVPMSSNRFGYKKSAISRYLAGLQEQDKSRIGT